MIIQETDFGLNLACAITLVVLGIYYIVTMFIVIKLLFSVRAKLNKKQ